MSSHKAKSKIPGYSNNMAKVVPTVESHQGRVVAFDEKPEAVEGPIEHPRTVILEFTSMAAFHARYDSPEYQQILPLRLNSTRGTLIVAKGAWHVAESAK